MLKKRQTKKIVNAISRCNRSKIYKILLSLVKDEFVCSRFESPLKFSLLEAPDYDVS